MNFIYDQPTKRVYTYPFLYSHKHLYIMKRGDIILFPKLSRVAFVAQPKSICRLLQGEA